MGVHGLALDGERTAYLTGYYQDETLFGNFFLSNQSAGQNIFFACLNVPSVPRLAISRASRSEVLSWPADLAGFQLESTADFTEPTWTPVTNVLSQTDQLKVLTNSSTGERRFFRLRK